MADQLVMTTQGANLTPSVLMDAAVQDLKAQLRGTLLPPDDDSYDVARSIWNAMIDKRPALIARCLGAADVIACVKFARKYNLLVSVRGGGHHAGGFSPAIPGKRKSKGTKRRWARAFLRLSGYTGEREPVYCPDAPVKDVNL